MIDLLNLSKHDQLFLLGDYINKGPQNLATLSYVQDLTSKHKNICASIGNHDRMILEYWNHADANIQEKLIQLGSKDLVELDGTLKLTLEQWLSNLPYFFILDHFLLVHAGFDFSLDEPYTDQYSMTNIKGFAYDGHLADNKTIIHGHWPHELAQIQDAIASKKPIIPIDNGCVYRGERPDQGNLVCLELNSLELIIQPNID